MDRTAYLSNINSLSVRQLVAVMRALKGGPLGYDFSKKTKAELQTHAHQLAQDYAAKMASFQKAWENIEEFLQDQRSKEDGPSTEGTVNAVTETEADDSEMEVSEPNPQGGPDTESPAGGSQGDEASGQADSSNTPQKGKGESGDGESDSQGEGKQGKGQGDGDGKDEKGKKGKGKPKKEPSTPEEKLAELMRQIVQGDQPDESDKPEPLTPEQIEAMIQKAMEDRAQKNTFRVEVETQDPFQGVMKDDEKPRHEVFKEVLHAINQGLNVLLVGPAGCIDGDAMVAINRGGKGFSLPLRDLVAKFHGAKTVVTMPHGGIREESWNLTIPTMVRGYVDGEFRLCRLLNAYPKGTKPVCKLILANGKTLRLTYDHEVLTSGGAWIRADCLMEGESVITNGRWIEKGYYQVSAGLKNHPAFGGKTDPDGYKMPEHRLIAEATLNGRTLEQWLEIIRDGNFPTDAKFIPQSDHVHHKDGNPLNNDRDNLVILTRSEHSKEHDFQKHFPMMIGEPVEVLSCDPDGEAEVFDLTVDEAHNFTANGVVVHNCGKTHMAEQVAVALGKKFRFTGAVASEYKLLGFITAQGAAVRTEYREAYEHGAVFLWDEIDASAAQAMLSFNAGLANGHQDFPDAIVRRHPDFRAIASANTYGTGADRMYVGRNQLDAASLDRFYVIEMDYDQDLEKALYGNGEWVRYVQSARKASRDNGIRHVISMRAIDMGLRMFKTGISRGDIEKAVLWKHLKKDDVLKIKRSMGLGA